MKSSIVITMYSILYAEDPVGIKSMEFGNEFVINILNYTRAVYTNTMSTLQRKEKRVRVQERDSERIGR